MPQMSMLNRLSEFSNAVYNKISQVVGEELAATQKPSQDFDHNSPANKLRRNLIREEVDELLEALEFKTREEVAKELADVLYVVLPVALMYDIPIEAVFNRVHENNMLKVKNGTVREDGKLVKSPSHLKVYLKDLFE